MLVHIFRPFSARYFIKVKNIRVRAIRYTYYMKRSLFFDLTERKMISLNTFLEKEWTLDIKYK